MSFCSFCKSKTDHVLQRSMWSCGTHFNDPHWRTKECYKRELNAANSKIDLLMSANADVARIAGERDKAEKRVLYLESALRKIANQDYRGNRSTESQIAFEALKEAKP